MEGGKDNRSKDKRNKMKQHRKKPMQHNNNNTSSSSQVEVLRGVVDVADSSDERLTSRRGWTMTRPQTQLAHRYSLDDVEDDLNEVEAAQMQAGDFAQMAQLPTSLGGHFQFSSEKHWDTAEGEQLLDNTEASEYFTLNLKLLNVGLQTIPFYKRMDYPASFFTREQILAMEQTAEVAEKNYQNVLREHETNPRIKINSGSRRTGSGRSQSSQAKQPTAATSIAGEAAAPDELDELLNMTAAAVAHVDLNVKVSGNGAENKATPQLLSTAGNETKEDIQQWLDNVLEE